MGKTKITFIADTHYYSKTLGTTGEAYRLRSESDQKCLAETAEIIDSAFMKLRESSCDAVAVVGDLSNDGERVCHEEFREKLYELRKHKKVFVVTATHDWCCDCNPRRYDGERVFHDVPTVNHNDLYDFYRDFGTADSISEYRTHLGTASYAVDIGGDVTLLGLIDDKNGKGSAGFKKSHLDWITGQIKNALERGRVPVAMEHHLLFPHISPLFTKGACCSDRENILNTFADAGLRFVFVGHSHIQRIDSYTSPAGNTIYEINVPSLSGYPAAMVSFTADGGEITVDTEYLEKFTLGGREKELAPFLADHATGLVSVLYDAAQKDDREFLAKRFEALQLKSEPIMKYYFAVAPALRGLSKMTVKSAGRALNVLTGGKAVDRQSVKNLGDMKVAEVIDRVMLNFFDGAVHSYEPSDDFYKIVRGTLGLPSRACRALNIKGKTAGIFDELDRAADEILTGGKISNHRLVVKK